jgi:CRP-like cAMP-binding protein
MIEQKTLIKLLPIINKCFLFTEVRQGDRVYQLIEAGAEYAAFNKGEWIDSQDIGLVISGQVQVLSKAHSSRAIILNVIEAAGIFRAATIFDFSEYASEETEIQASKKTKAILFSPDLMLNIFVEHPPLLKKYLAFLGNRIRFLNRKIQALTAGSAQERLLLFLADYESQVQQVAFALPMQVGQLAKSLNMSRATLYRTIEELSALNIIEYQDKKIIIKDFQALKIY